MSILLQEGNFVRTHLSGSLRLGDLQFDLITCRNVEFLLRRWELLEFVLDGSRQFLTAFLSPVGSLPFDVLSFLLK